MAGVDEVLFQPTFQGQAIADDHPVTARDDVAAVKTYRYLRLGMVVVVVAVVAAVLLQRRDAGCWQGSISAYYYTPARAVFVSGMVAIAVSLVVIKGSTVLEDLFLAAAGVLAPIVAFVPTTFEPACTPGQPLPDREAMVLPPSIVADVENNIAALLVAGVAALVLGVVVFVVERRQGDTDGQARLRSLLLVGTAAVLGLGTWLWASHRILDLHGLAAIAMFVALGLAALWSGAWLWRSNRAPRPGPGRHGADAGPGVPARWRLYAVAYLAVAAAMLLLGVVIGFVWPEPWDHRTLVLELVEIALFVAMWTIQSFERWGRILLPAPPAGGAPPGRPAGSAQPSGAAGIG